MNFTSRIGLGTVQFGLPYGIANKLGQPDRATVASVLRDAIENDISVFDTAGAYGTAELLLGEFLPEEYRSQVRIVSKYMPPAALESLESQVFGTLERLKLESLHGYLSHRPRNLLKHPDQWTTLKKLKGDGHIKKIGYSLNEPAELEALLDAGMKPDLIQVPFSWLDRRFQPWFPRLKSMGTEIHVRSVYLQGLFFLEHFPERFSAVEQPIRSLQQEISNLPAALLCFVLDEPNVDVAIIGVQNDTQLRDILNGLPAAPDMPKLETEVSDDILMPSKWSN